MGSRNEKAGRIAVAEQRTLELTIAICLFATERDKKRKGAYKGRLAGNVRFSLIPTLDFLRRPSVRSGHRAIGSFFLRYDPLSRAPAPDGAIVGVL